MALKIEYIGRSKDRVMILIEGVVFHRDFKFETNARRFVDKVLEGKQLCLVLEASSQ